MPRCKNCKEKFTPIKFNMKFCLKKECLKVFVEESKEKAWKQTKTRMKAELKTQSDWLKDAQRAFNKHVRERDKSKPCISCNNALGAKFDAGHFFSMGGHRAVTFDEDNVHGQCVACNQHKHGNLIAYQEGLIKRIGQERYDILKSKAYEVKKWSVEELKEIIKKYK